MGPGAAPRRATRRPGSRPERPAGRTAELRCTPIRYAPIPREDMGTMEQDNASGHVPPLVHRHGRRGRHGRRSRRARRLRAGRRQHERPPRPQDGGQHRERRRRRRRASDVHIHNVTDTSWMTPPAEVTDFAQELGPATRWSAATASPASPPAASWPSRARRSSSSRSSPRTPTQAVGNEFASLNAKILQERGVPHIDPVEFYQNFMKITSNMPNPSLVMKFAQNSEENSNWYLDRLTEEDFATMTTAFFPPTEHQMGELSGIKFWPSGVLVLRRVQPDEDPDVQPGRGRGGRRRVPLRHHRRVHHHAGRCRGGSCGL